MSMRFLLCAGLLALPLPGFGQMFGPEEEDSSPSGVEKSDGLVLEEGLEPQLSARLVGVVPTLKSGNLSRASEFYTKSLGFDVVLSEGSQYMALARDGIRVGIALNPSMTRADRNFIYINVSGIDALHEEYKKRGLKFAKDIATQPSKMREFSILDPDSNTLMFGEYVGQ